VEKEGEKMARIATLRKPKLLKVQAARWGGDSQTEPTVGTTLTARGPGFFCFPCSITGGVTARLSSIIDVQGQAWITATEFRRDLIKDSFHMLREHPLLGVGLGNFETAYPPYQSFPSDLTIDFAHNDYMQAFAETGLIGAGLILSAILLFLNLAFGDCRQKLRSGHGWIQLGAALGCCGLLVHWPLPFLSVNADVPRFSRACARV
jgi:O-antigen ligase